MKRQERVKKRNKNFRSLKNIRFSPEIEVEFPNTKDSQELIKKHRIIRGWTIDMDGSLNNGAEYRPTDRNHLTWKEDTFDQLKEIIGLIKAHRGKVKESTCGLHLHVDMKKFNDQEIVNIIKAFIKNQKQIYQKFKINPDRKTYAQEIPKKVINELTVEKIKNLRQKKERDYEGDYFGDRHYSLNVLALYRHGTLEFRIFSGSLKINKIKEAIKFAINFCLKNSKG